MEPPQKLDAALVAWAIICAAAFALLFWIWSVTVSLISKV
jgi:hypothetical protein